MWVFKIFTERGDTGISWRNMKEVKKYTEIEKCRISGSKNLVTVLSLGEQYLTGVFPKSEDEEITKGPLDLVWCPDSGLLQMKQSFSIEEMYG